MNAIIRNEVNTSIINYAGREYHINRIAENQYRLAEKHHGIIIEMSDMPTIEACIIHIGLWTFNPKINYTVNDFLVTKKLMH